MQITNVLPNLTRRWSTNWKARQLSRRLVSLAYQWLGYLVITLLMLGIFAGLVGQVLPVREHSAAIQFTGLVFLCCLGIVTAHSFDTDEIRYLLNKIYDEAERIETNTTSPEIYELRKQVEELIDRMRQA